MVVFSVLTVLVVPDSVTVDVPFVKTEPTPDVSQLPDTVADAEVNVIVPDAPPVIVTSVKVKVELLASRSPPLGTLRLAPPEMAFPLVVKVPDTDSVCETSMALDCVMVPDGVKS